ncbi:hypothetical protein KBC86_03690 [Candidatus Gracilibacteria bacterium]|nr:hypothetical protein [Candidatus Gracilibacteria bacterium]
MSLSNHPENVIPASINKRDGLLDDILYYIAEAGIFDREEKDLHKIIRLSISSMSESALVNLLAIAESDIDGFRESFLKIMSTTREIRERFKDIFALLED